MTRDSIRRRGAQAERILGAQCATSVRHHPGDVGSIDTIHSPAREEQKPILVEVGRLDGPGAVESVTLVGRHFQLDGESGSFDVDLHQEMNDRLVVMHDLWHVLLGYDATNAGESALMCFMLPHRFNDRALPIFITMSLSTGRISWRNAWEAFVRGRRASFMVAAPFEDLLALPLDEARERLEITPLEVGHPVVTSEAMLNPVEGY